MPSMYYKVKYKAYAMAELLISSLITMIIISICMHYVLSLNKYTMQFRRQFAYNSARLRARHHLLQDLAQAKTTQIHMHSLRICDLQCIQYELRNSVLPESNPMHALALYRIAPDRRAEAIVEGITNWQLTLDGNALRVIIYFLDQQQMEIVHWLPI